MKAMRAVWVLGVGLLLAAVPVLAHHSFKAEYDTDQPITLKGVITKVNWKNPHVQLYMDVKEPSGETAKWELELSSPNGLLSQGWTPSSLKPGDQVIVEGYRARNGSNVANARKVTITAC